MSLEEALAQKEETLARKRDILDKLVRNADTAIRKEMLKYEEAEFYIHLRSECFNLYPVAVKALASLILDDQKRDIFCSIVKGHKLDRLAAYHNMTEEEAAREFRTTVMELHRRVKEGALTAKESANLRLMRERNLLQHKVRESESEIQGLKLENGKLLKRLDMFWECQRRRLQDEKKIKMEREQTIRKEIRMELQKQMRKKTEAVEMNVVETARRVPLVARCVKWFKENW